MPAFFGTREVMFGPVHEPLPPSRLSRLGTCLDRLARFDINAAIAALAFTSQRSGSSTGVLGTALFDAESRATVGPGRGAFTTTVPAALSCQPRPSLSSSIDKAASGYNKCSTAQRMNEKNRSG